MASRKETEKEKGTIRYSKEVGALLEKSNIIFLISLGLIDFFKVICSFPVLDEEMAPRIEYWSKEYKDRGKCIFSMRHTRTLDMNLMYLSEMTEEELIRLISLKVFW